MITKLILNILSQSLVFNATCRRNFGHGKAFSEIDIISLLFVNIGPIRIFVFSYDLSNSNFQICRIIKYSEIAKWPTKTDIDDVMQRNVAKFVPANMPAIDYKLSTEIERFTILMNRIPNYITVIVFAMPLYYALFSMFSKIPSSMILSIFAVYLLFGCVNILCLILSIKQIVRSDLNEMIANSAESKYFDWQIRKRENDFYAGLVKNLERSFLFSLIFAVIAAGIGLSTKNEAPKTEQPKLTATDSPKTTPEKIDSNAQHHTHEPSKDSMSINNSDSSHLPKNIAKSNIADTLSNTKPQSHKREIRSSHAARD